MIAISEKEENTIEYEILKDAENALSELHARYDKIIEFHKVKDVMIQIHNDNEIVLDTYRAFEFTSNQELLDYLLYFLQYDYFKLTEKTVCHFSITVTDHYTEDVLAYRYALYTIQDMICAARMITAND